MLDFEIHILAGGKSSRMGQDKGLMEFKGLSMIEHVLTACEALNSSVKIVTNNFAYTQFKKPLVSDNFSEIGPLGGIEAGLKGSEKKTVLFLPCDIPHITAEILDELEACRTADTICIAADSNGMQPLIGFYPTSCLSVIQNQIKNSNYKITHLFDHFPLKVINFESAPSHHFKNMNSPEDL